MRWTKTLIEKTLNENPDYPQFHEEFEGKHQLYVWIKNIPVYIYRLPGGIYESYLGPIIPPTIDIEDIDDARRFAIESAKFLNEKYNTNSK